VNTSGDGDAELVEGRVGGVSTEVNLDAEESIGNGLDLERIFLAEDIA
jgi:hypothetical protein